MKTITVADRKNCLNTVESALRFGAWADKQGCRLSVHNIKTYLECSTATAYRYFNSYLAARGVEAVR